MLLKGRKTPRELVKGPAAGWICSQQAASNPICFLVALFDSCVMTLNKTASVSLFATATQTGVGPAVSLCANELKAAGGPRRYRYCRWAGCQTMASLSAPRGEGGGSLSLINQRGAEIANPVAPPFLSHGSKPRVCLASGAPPPPGPPPPPWRSLQHPRPSRARGMEGPKGRSHTSI